MAEKPCSVCKETLPTSRFYPRQDRPSGFVSCCKTCWPLTHSAAQRKYRASFKSRAANRQHSETWRVNHPQEYAAKRHKRRMSKAAATGTRTNASIVEVIAWRINQLKAQNNRCYWRFPGCKAERMFSSQARPTEDHVIPIASGGLDDFSNIVFACFSCNASKGKRRLTPL